MGLCHFQRGEYARALARFRRALELDPHDQEAAFSLAATYGRLGDGVAQRKYLALTATLGPGSPRGQQAREILGRMGSPVPPA